MRGLPRDDGSTWGLPPRLPEPTVKFEQAPRPAVLVEDMSMEEPAKIRKSARVAAPTVSFSPEGPAKKHRRRAQSQSPPPSSRGGHASSYRAGGKRQAHDAEGNALTRCEARLKRLEKLNKVLDALSDKSWADTENRAVLAANLRLNPYYPAIQQAVRERRRTFLVENAAALQGAGAGGEPKGALGLSSKATACGANAEAELRQLRALEQQSLETLRAMAAAASDDIPMCEEEVRAATDITRAAYSPAKLAFAQALETGLRAAEARKNEDQDEDSSYKKQRGHHLSDEAVAVLQAWLVSHFEDPYPNEEEKAALVRMTKVSLRQINNWMSNARVRIWRPAVLSLKD